MTRRVRQRGAARPAGSGRVRRDTGVLIVARFFMSSAQSISSVAMPVALVQAGAHAGTVGTVLALGTVAGLIETVLVGAFADRGFFRIFLVSFPLTSVLGIAPFLAGSGTVLLGAGAVFAGYGGGSGANSGGTGPYQPAEYGWVARNYGAERRNLLISRFSASSVAGVVLASVIALSSSSLSRASGFGASQADQARFLMLVVGIFALVPTVLGGLVTEPERVVPAHRLAGASPVSRRQKLQEMFWPRHSRALLKQLSIVGGLNGVAIGTYGAFVSVWLILRFHATAGRLGLINLLISATAVLGDLCCPWIARQLGLVRSVIVTRSLQSLLIIPIAFSPDIFVAEILLVARQLAQRLNQPLRDSYVLGRSDAREKSRMSAMSNLTNQGMQAASSQTAGQVIDRIGFSAPFVFAAFCQLASGALFFYYFSKQPPPEEHGSVPAAASDAASPT